MRRRQVFFEKKLHAIRQRLQQSERADARGSPAVLHVPDNFALQPDGIGHRRQQHEQRQHDLNERNDNEVADAQCSEYFFLRPACLSRSVSPCGYIAPGKSPSVGGNFSFRRLLTVLHYGIQSAGIAPQCAGTE